MQDIRDLLSNNQGWAAQMIDQDPSFFQRLTAQQSPAYMWIGCSDSRVPANQLVGLPPGEMFVHRNVANIVVHSDLNCLAVLQYAVDVLAVRHIIVCGHYGCGGVDAALNNRRFGLIDNWLRHVQDIRNKHAELLGSCPTSAEQFRRLCELNVIEQVVNVCQTTIVHEAWQRGQKLAIHGWIYDVADGLIQNIGITISQSEDLAQAYDRTLAQIAAL